MNIKQIANDFNIWEGVYTSFQESKKDAVGDGFSGRVYREKSLKAAIECMRFLKNNHPIPLFHKQRSSLLPVAVAMMLNHNGMLKILDFGGGLGIGYMVLSESITNDMNRIDYKIIEDEDVCNVGNDLWGGEIDYSSTVPTTSCFDLIHAASSLQYIESWQDLLKKFARLNPSYILLSDVFAGYIDSYVSLQSYYGSKIPHWFLNIGELLDCIAEIGYKVIMQSDVSSRRLNAVDILPMDNFPENLRLLYSKHFLLQKIN